MKHTALLFDLDGVLVDTAKYHFLAWKRLADELHIPFTEQDNERFKGVSRIRCMEILLEMGERTMSPDEFSACCARKNSFYLEYIREMEADEVLPGVPQFLDTARTSGYRTALGSASKNAALILDRLHLTDYFDAVVDGTQVSRAKPDPEVFLRGAALLDVPPQKCIVFEDAAAGIRAAHAGGMAAVGIGTREALPEADIVLPGFVGAEMEMLENRLSI